MHLTKSIDYAVILEGEIEMYLDDGSCTILRQGKYSYLSISQKFPERRELKLM
jgi:hypothetical protein